MDAGTIEHIEIVPYSPEWWKARNGTFTGSEAFKLMSEPRGKSPFEKYEDHVNMLRKWEQKYSEVPESKRELKGNKKLFAKIEENRVLLKELYEHRNDVHLSDTAETYILQKVHEKITGMAKVGIDNAATNWGIENEPLAQKWYKKLSGHELHPAYMKFHDELEGFSCTPDNLVNEDRLTEIKCPYEGSNHLKHCFIHNDEYFKTNHPNYYWQCVTQMNVFKRELLDFVSFDPRIPTDFGMFVYNMKYDESEGNALEERVKVCRNLFNDYYKLFAQ